MAFTGNNINLETRFQLDTTPNKLFRFNDLTDYAGVYGIALTDVVGIFKEIKDPTGATVYSNTNFGSPDIDHDSSTVFNTVNLPTDSDGKVIRGNYTITYAVRVTGATDPGDYEKTYTFNFQYQEPDLKIEHEIDFLCSKFKSTDATDYPATTSNKVLTHTLKPPVGSGKPDQTVSTVDNLYSGLVTKTWVTDLSVDLEVNQTDGLIVEDTITGTKETEVSDSLKFCEINCCIDSIMTEYQKLLQNNIVEADRYFRSTVSQAITYMFLYQNAIKCGQNDIANSYYDNLLEVTGCDPDCTCSDSDEPTLIEPLCGPGTSGTFVVQACGANDAIEVTSQTVGSTTTYTVCLKQSLYTKLTNLRNASVNSPNSTINVTEVTLPDGSVRYDIDVATASAQPNIMAQVIEFDYTGPNKPTLNTIRTKKYGSLLQAGTYTDDYNGDSVAVWEPKSNCFTISAYEATSPGKEAIVTADIVKYDYSGNPACDQIQNIMVEVIDEDTTAGTIKFRFVEPGGFVYTNKSLSDIFNKIKVAFKFTA